MNQNWKSADASADQTLDALIIGAGFGGLYLLHHLRQEGFRVRVLEAGKGPGGVWTWNQYPGVRVDSATPLYEFSAPELWSGWNWSERYPGGAELRAYFAHVVRTWNLADGISFETRMASARFDDASSHWLVTTSAGERIRTRFLVTATGSSSKPLMPSIPGAGDFRNEYVHSALWPEHGPDMRGKKVVILGTGASGVQLVQEASKVASHVTVLQRTPNLALPMRQQTLSADQQSAAKREYPALYERRMRSFTGLDFDFIPENAVELSVADRTSKLETLWEGGGFRMWLGVFQDVVISPQSNRIVYDFWRDQTRRRIRKPGLLETLAPTEPPHPYGVKRPSLEQDYFEALNQDHVELVDLRCEPLTHLSVSAVCTSAKEYEADLFIVAAGFDSVTGGLGSADIRGSSGQTLGDHWRERVKSYMGYACRGFPNLLMMYGPLSPTGFVNGPSLIEQQGNWIVGLLKRLRAEGRERIEATAEAEAQWGRLVDEIIAQTLFPLADSWYMGANVPGKVRQMLLYAGGFPDYQLKCDEALSSLQGFVVH